MLLRVQASHFRHLLEQLHYRCGKSGLTPQITGNDSLNRSIQLVKFEQEWLPGISDRYRQGSISMLVS
jgi:hypothetical protein